MTPAKPPKGDPCNGCGICCLATPCRPAGQLLKDAVPFEPCPALEWEDGRSWCGLVRNPTRHMFGHRIPIIGRLLDRWIGREVEKALGGHPGCDATGRVGLTAPDWINLVALGLEHTIP